MPDENLDWNEQIRRHSQMFDAAFSDPENLAVSKTPPAGAGTTRGAIRRLCAPPTILSFIGNLPKDMTGRA